MIRKRGTKWQVRVDLGRERGGGRFVYGTAATKKSAKELEASLRTDAARGDLMDPSKVTVADYLTGWLERRTDITDKTRERYREVIDCHLIPAIGSHRLTGLQPVHVEDMLTNAVRTGGRRRQGLSPQTVKHHYRVLKLALSDAVRLRLLNRNPCDDVKPPKVPRKKVGEDIAILDAGQMKTLMDRLQETRLFVPSVIAMTTGLRRGEILALQWDDIDMPAGTITVRRALQEVGKAVTVKPPKTDAGYRTVKVPPFALDIIQDHRMAQLEERMMFGLGKPDHLFTTVTGKLVHPRYFTIEFGRIVKSIEIPPVTFHGLRHSHLTALMRAGVHPKVASERAGHSSVKVTLDVYSHVTPDMENGVADVVEQELGARWVPNGG